MMIERLHEQLRWQIARWLDRCHDTCWAALASWALYPEWYSWADLQHLRRGTAGACARRGDPPYCGKCEEAIDE